MAITLKAARVNVGLTQSEVAEKLQCGRSSIINWESGKTSIPFIKLSALCSLYNVGIDEIVLPQKSTLS